MEILTTIITEKIPTTPAFEAYFGKQSMGVLDIETTGLSPKYYPVILAGLLMPNPRGPGLILHQYFAERPIHEKDLLKSLFSDYSSLDFVITYNGRSFDLPFLDQRFSKLGLPPLPSLYNLDLYRIVKKHSDISRFTPNLKQKTLENFLGLWQHRDDEISGGESVNLYGEFLLTGSSQTKKKILLHNKDDVLQLYRLFKVLPKVDFHKAMYTFGFPVFSKGRSFIVDRLKVGKNSLDIDGVQRGKPVHYVYYGGDFPSFRFTGHRFSLTVPILSHRDMTLVDLEGMGLSWEEAVDGYTVLKNSDELRYREINTIARLLLERIVEKWITEN